MRDIERLRRRLLVAMGIVGATQLAAAGCSDTEQATPGTTSDVAGDSGSALDSTVEDAASHDAASDDANGADDAGGEDAMALFPPPTCDNGQPSVQCFDSKQLRYDVDLAFLNGGPIPVDHADFDLPPDGCPPRERVFEGCCNAATTDPELYGDVCCYGFCVGSCCGRPLRRTAEAAFDAALNALPGPRMPLGIDAEGWAACGLLTPTRHQSTVAALVRSVSRPCADALLADC